ncbi:MAG TPA: hypothetical protein VFB34_02140, partial [Chloroflexota bacterium]|nr:hypothetical protein [Chloroflexota bacterium]
GTQMNSQTISGSTLGPGVYHGGISLSGGTYTMSPGVYVMDGGGLTLSGGVTITGNGVFIYNSDSASPSSCSPISLSGNGTITLDAPTSGTYRGLVLAQDPSCATMATISGNGAPALNGGFYFPDATVDLSGNGSQSGGLQALIVADKVEASGNGNVYLAKPTIAPILIGTVLVE